MSAQRYERISAHADDDYNDSPVSATSLGYQPDHQIPSSPPPSFHSRTSSISHNGSPTSPTRRSDREPLVSDADRTLADTFDSPSDDESDDDETTRLDDRQRVMSGRPATDSDSEDGSNGGQAEGRPAVERRVTQLPVYPPAGNARMVQGGGNQGYDGVFANLSAKPERGEETEEKPPTYEQAAADATPPYWENTILAPGGTGSDEVFIDGLPVGSLFSFIWNGMISMSFQLVGFLLTYLLHTTHAAKNGSKAGLGITLVQYGFSMKGAASSRHSHPTPHPPGGGVPTPTQSVYDGPSDPNTHNFDPNASIKGDNRFIPNAGNHTGPPPPGVGDGNGFGAMHASDWFAYALMIVGWFVLIRAISEYLKARRHEALVMQSPSRGLNIAVVAEGENPDRSV